MLELADLCRKAERHRCVQLLREAYAILYGEDNYDVYRTLNRYIEAMALVDAAMAIIPPGCVEMTDWYRHKGDPVDLIVHEVDIQRMSDAQTIGQGESTSRCLAFIEASMRAHAHILELEETDA